MERENIVMQLFNMPGIDERAGSGILDIYQVQKNVVVYSSCISKY